MIDHDQVDIRLAPAEPDEIKDTGISTNSLLRLLLKAMYLRGLELVPALAGALDDPRASGAVGERFDGFLELRDASAAGAKAKVAETNKKRRKIYEKRASAKGVEVAQVGQVYAQQIMGKAPKGTWFLKKNGKWIQK